MPFVEVEEGVVLHYELSGTQGAPNKILCVMGWATCYKMGNWENQTEYFAQLPEFEVCIFDNRGSGLSSTPPGRYSMEMLAQDALKIVDHLGWDKVHLMGASMGGMVAQRAALLAPEKISSLTLLCTRFDSGWWYSLPTWTALGIIVKQQVEALVFRDHTSHTRHLLSLLFSHKYLEDSHASGNTNRQYLIEKMSSRKQDVPPMNVKGSLSQLAAIQGHQVTREEVEKLMECSFNILIITGDNDLMVPHKHSLNIKSMLQHRAELVVIEGAGHGVLEESKHEINQKVRDFILSSN